MLAISRFVSIRAALSLPLILSACASFESNEVKLQLVRTVGIISAVGDEFSFTTAGLAGLDRGDRRYSVASWDLDDMIVREASMELSGRFQVQPLSYSRAAFAASETESPVTLVKLIHEDKVTALLRKEPPAPSVDAYIVIVKAQSSIGPSNRKVEGIGLVKYASAFGSYAQLYALYEIRVIDGHSLKLIEKRPAAPLEHGVVRLAGPTQLIQDAALLDTGDPASNEKLHDAIVGMISRSLPSTLRNLHLTGEH
jgi:hypothetical protein